MKIDLTQAELDALIAIVDAGIKTVGIQALRPAMFGLVGKITAAAQEQLQVPREKASE